MKQHATAMVLSSLVADALSLGAHWIYDTELIETTFGTINRMHPPLPDSYHPTKKKGEFTHYGDQTMLLLRHLAENGDFDLSIFAKKWYAFSANYTGYVDNATKVTLRALDEGKSPDTCGSNSSDLGGPARIAPLIFWYSDDDQHLLQAAQEQTLFTHRGSGVQTATEILVRIVQQVLSGATPSAALETLLDEGVNDLDLDMRLRSAVESAGHESRKVIAQFGQMCATSAALPGAIHLVLSCQENLREALIRNVMAGGDSAARGLVIGMILGAYQGMDALDGNWLDEMQATMEIKQLLAAKQ